MELIFAAVLGLAIGIFAGHGEAVDRAGAQIFPASAGASRCGRVSRISIGRTIAPCCSTVSLGLGTFLLLNLYLTREVLLAQFRSVGSGTQPNIFLFDIQPDQAAAVAETVRSLGMPVIQEAAIVAMKLDEVKGRKTTEILADPQRKIPEWQLQRDYRSTYREQLSDTEKIVDGEWIGRVDYKPGDVVPISIDKEIARDFEAKIGDELVFDVQGVPIRTRIASTRDIDWKRFQTNFFVVFPVGVLENAPGFNVIVSRVPNAEESARLQNGIVAKFPNVSALDLTAVIQTVDSILSKVALVIRVMSLFTVGAGLIVLGEHDLEWPLSAPEGERVAAHARRFPGADLADPVRRISSCSACLPVLPALCLQSHRAGDWRDLSSSSSTRRPYGRCSSQRRRSARSRWR